MKVFQLYKENLNKTSFESKINEKCNEFKVQRIRREICFNIEIEDELSDDNLRKLKWILSEPFQEHLLNEESVFRNNDECKLIIEIGPRLSFSTSLCTNAVSICRSAGLKSITKLERSDRYEVETSVPLTDEIEDNLVNELHDPMTQCRYKKALTTFTTDHKRLAWHEVDVLGEDEEALAQVNAELGLGFDLTDIAYYTSLFKEKMKKNPTTVECFDLAQSNSEHSRHWFFNGQMVIDGKVRDKTMFQMVKDTLNHSNKNNVIAFKDNSSAIEGYKVKNLAPLKTGEASSFTQREVHRHITFTAETHNFPTGVAPFPGATTGTGGRQRDQHAAGRGSHVVAGFSGYCVGNLNLPHHSLSWEDNGTWSVPPNLASATNICIQASDGASDYGNKFGEPVTGGFFRSFGLILPNGERREWLKPIMFSSGIGSIEHENVEKIIPTADADIVVAKIGGPAYRIGVGGGSASSVEIHGDNSVKRDFDAVQRGDAEMQQKLNRLIRACIEGEGSNPILSIHDQGAGGNGNVLKEIVEPAGAVIHAKSFTCADNSLTTLELWAAEYQESDAILLKRDDVDKVKKISLRERCSLDVVGEITGDGRIILKEDSVFNVNGSPTKKSCLTSDRHPVDLNLEHVLGKMPQKTYRIQSADSDLKPVVLPEIPIKEMLIKVLMNPAVGSKRFLTNKVDRCVTGLIAQQQCVGPLHTPLADVSVVAMSHFTNKGAASAIGEQPIKMLVNPSAGARLTVAETLTNLVFAAVTELKDVKCSANWMWPAKLLGEGSTIYEACSAMCEVMNKLGVAVDGGKDSLSMASRVEQKTIKCPGSLVVSAYAPCPDVTKKVTPDLKCSKESTGHLVYVPMTMSPYHLGGSALAHCYGQIGDNIPDLDDVEMFVRAWNITQDLIKEGKITAGHDISDGGLIVTLLEMAFAGNCGLNINIKTEVPTVNLLFSENPGIVVETTDVKEVLSRFCDKNVKAKQLGRATIKKMISIQVNGEIILDSEQTAELRDIWESTSFALEMLQCNPACVQAEREWLQQEIKDPPHFFDFKITLPAIMSQNDVCVAIIREEGSNGDREMAAAFVKAGFQAWDITMEDLYHDVTLDRFQGIAFVGGFSYADVFGSAKGWAACALFNDKIRRQFDMFHERKDTFSLGVCNGCQLMALLGWVGNDGIVQPQTYSDSLPKPKCFLTHNASGRFESRYVTVKINNSASIMLSGMEGTQLGVWVAHGEGQFLFENEEMSSKLLSDNLVALQYIDHSGNPTMQYPLNPNGSKYGISGICSKDGRHLAMMPHPERSVNMWNLPWKPDNWDNDGPAPWQRMFNNARNWCLDQGLNE